MRDLTQAQRADIAKAAKSDARFYGGVVVESFNLMEAAAGIEHELKRISHCEEQRITLHMNGEHAAWLAKQFRKIAILGAR